MTFQSLWEASDEQTRYDLDERAAIHQFDGQLSRLEAEQRTVEDFSGQNEQRDLMLL